mgnify:FL=1
MPDSSVHLKPWHIILPSLLFLLVSCVSMNDKTHLISDADPVANVDGNVHAHELTTCRPGMRDIKTSTLANNLNPAKISLLNWNIYKGNMVGWQQDLSAYLKDHDLMTIQEATLDQQFTEVLESNDFNWTMNAAFNFNGSTAGVMNVANADSIYSCGFKVKEPIIRIPKSTLISYYAIEGSDDRLLMP